MKKVFAYFNDVKSYFAKSSDQTRTEYKRDVAGPCEMWRDLSTRLNTHNVGRNGKYRVAKRQDLREEIEVTKQPL